MSFFSPSNLLSHLQKYIPRLSDRFSNNASVTAEIVDGDPQILRVTDTAHSLSVGRQVVFIDSKIDNPITAVQLFTDSAGNSVRFTVENGHDLTLDYTPEVELAGFTDSQFNGTFDLLAVPDRTSFEISFETLPVLNGNEVLRETWEIGLDDLFTIDRVIDVDTYEIDLTDKPYFTPQTVPNIRRASQFRLAVSVDAKRAEAVYTKQSDLNSLWLYIIMGDSVTSKDRNVKSDASQTNTAQNPSRNLLINTFSLVVFMPTETELMAANASDLAWEELLQLMLATGAGIKFDDFGNTQYLSTLINHGTGLYTNAYYTHVYTFEYNYEVTQEENFLTQFIESRAFRDNVTDIGGIEGTLDLDDDA